MNRQIYLDSCCLIYLIEEVPELSSRLKRYLSTRIDSILCVSAIVRLEVLVKPMTNRDEGLIADYEDFIREQNWLPINDTIVAGALRLRVDHGIKIPDAIHLATALHYECKEFLTNDDRLGMIAKAVGCVAVNIAEV